MTCKWKEEMSQVTSCYTITIRGAKKRCSYLIDNILLFGNEIFFRGVALYFDKICI